jgi:thiamine biosynthesis lipoprotein
VIGSKNRSNPWKLGIGHPRRSGELLGTLRLPNDRALGTSADTQNFFIKNGVRYSHLINPHTGFPSREKILVTVTAPTAVEADLLSTAFFVLPAQKILAFTEKHPEIGAVTVARNGLTAVFNEPHFTNAK